MAIVESNAGKWSLLPLLLLFINFNFYTDIIIGSFNVTEKGFFAENVDALAQIPEKLKELFASFFPCYYSDNLLPD